MKRKYLSILLVLILAFSMVACSGDDDNEPVDSNNGATNNQDKGTTDVVEDLIVLTGSDASTFDPHFCTDSATEIFNKNMYNNLVRFTSDMELIPDLADSWEISEDQLTWTFKLKEGVEFHDGTPFNAEAVKVSFERVLNPDVGSPRRSVLVIIDKVEVVDEYRVSITTSTPAGSLLQQLAHPVAAIISPTALDTHGEKISDYPTGTGPFKFVEWKIGEEIIMESNEDYFNGAPKIGKLIFRVVPEDSTRSLLLESGQADVAMRLPVTELQRLESKDSIEVDKSDTVMTMYIAINNNKGPLKDARIRQALNYATDKNIIIDHILEGMGTLSDSPISPSTWGYNSIGAYEHDVEKAKQLLTEAGYPDGIDLEIWTPIGRYLMDTQVTENLQAQWADAGMNVSIRQWEFQALMEEVKKGEFDMVLLGWSPSTGDADQGLYPVFHSTQWPPASNRAHYANDTVDKLLEDAKIETDSAKRLQLYKEAEQIIMDEAAWVFLYYPKQAVSYSSDISGMEVLPTEHILFEKVVK